MALCLAESLIQCQGLNSVGQLTRYCRWYRDGYFSCKDHCFDIGNTTRTALHAFEQSGRPDVPTDPFTAGNGIFIFDALGSGPSFLRSSPG